MSIPFPNPQRRRLLAAPLALAATPWADVGGLQAQTLPVPAAGTGRTALLIGNRDYPGGQDLPSMHTNVRDLQAALQGVGFEVTTLLDQDRAGALQAVEAFSRRLAALPPDGVALFYFCGHGMQIDAENFLLPSRTYPRERPLKDSMALYLALWRHVIQQMPRRPAGLTITVVDACRSSPKAISEDPGLNQVRAPEGELIVFSTGAGKPALAPTNEKRRTFFTDALVKQIEAQARAPQELTFRELFRLVSADVQATMLAHPVEDVRELVQVPFIADSSGTEVRVALQPVPARPLPSAAASQPGGVAAAAEGAAPEEAAYEALRQALWPADVQRLASGFAQRFPDSRFRSAAAVAALGADDSAKLLARADIQLYRRDFQPRPGWGAAELEDLRRAARGDKDAAARIAARVRSPARSGPQSLQFEGWMQYAAELGNGIASYELARYYSEVSQPALVGRWIGRAKELGYNPPPQLRLTR